MKYASNAGHFTHVRVVLTGHFDIMDPHVEAPDVDAVQTTHVGTTDDDIVDFSVGACVEDEVERRRIDETDVMDAELVHADEANQPRAILAILEELVAIALNGAASIAAIQLKVGRVLN